MKAIFRNFFFVLKRFKTSSILNILGLSVAFAVFSVTMIQVYYDFSFDRNFKKSDRIYEFSQRLSEGERGITMPTPLAKEMSDVFPEIKDYCLTSFSGESTFDIPGKNETMMNKTENITHATVGLLNVFTPEIIAGDARRALTEKNKALISESTARKFFGNDNPLGKTINMHFEKTSLTVTAVYKDFPKNCSLTNGIFVYLPDDEPSNFNYKGYFEVFPKDLNKLLGKLNGKKFYGEQISQRISKPELKITGDFTLLPKMHFYFLEQSGSGSLTTTLSLLAIGILTLVIAYINFLNFSIAMAPARVRGLNIQKILGAKLRTLRFAIAAEASLFSILSFVIALFLVYILKSSSIYEYFSADLSLQNNWHTLLVIGCSAIVFGLIFGLYPARYVTSFQPAVALSGSFSLSGKSMKLRNVLITLQFIFAITLIIVSTFIRIQNSYMQNYSWGIQKENIVYVPYGQLKIKMKSFGDELKKDPHVLDYTASQFLPGEVGMSWGRDFEEKQVTATIWPVHSNFLRFFGVKIMEGRDLLETDSIGHGLIFNQSFLKKYALKGIIGKNFNGFGICTIIGVAKNINFSSLRDSIQPMAFTILNDEWTHWFFIKITGKDTPETIKFIKKTWEKYSDDDFNLKFLNQSMNDLYKNESNLAKLISIFGLVIIVIAIMGVYGLIVFNARYKSKEIALRKVNGASVKEIMLMLNRNVLIQLSIAYIVAVPFAYYIVHRWLEQFAYKTPVYWWVFLLAGLLILVITVITVSWQSHKASTANPVDAIKNE
jgi:putative ABC transport system permease protein